MRKMSVAFKKPEDIINFVKIVNRYENDVDLKCGRYLVDAKSLISAFTLSNSNNVEMLIHGDECTELINHISEYVRN